MINSNANQSQASQTEAPAFELDFDSDEPLPACPMRKDGLAEGEICEACQ